MKKPAKILLGVATLWPFIYMILFFGVILWSFFFIASSGGQEASAPFPFLLIFPLHILTMFWIMGLTIFYMVNLFRNERVDKDKKVLWAVVLFLGNMIAMPIYWYLYIWNEAPAVSTRPLPLGSVDTSAWTGAARVDNRRPEYAPPPEPPNWRE